MRTVYVTAPPDAAGEIARTLVEERLAACVNRVDCRSTYRWDGEVVDDDEELLLAKTTVDGVDALVERVLDLHPYDVPCVETFEAADATDPFAEWAEDSVA
jgi:periplasmic divalent cation tolerance protein